MSKTPDETIYTVGDVAGELGVQPSHLRRMIDDGRVPFVLKLGGSWMLEPRSREFVLAWYPKLGTGKAGQEAAAMMREAAAEIDPECKKRAAAWSSARPHGWSTSMVAPKRVQAIRKVWPIMEGVWAKSRSGVVANDIRFDKHKKRGTADAAVYSRAAHFFKLLCAKVSPAYLSPADLASIAGITKAQAASIFRDMKKLGIIRVEQHTMCFTYGDGK